MNAPLAIVLALTVLVFGAFWARLDGICLAGTDRPPDASRVIQAFP
jgi:hypothetical protein